MIELSISKEILNILNTAGVSRSDIPFWGGAVNLDFSAYRVLLQYLRAATAEEIKNFNMLLKEKIAIFKSGDKGAMRALVARERQMILQ